MWTEDMICGLCPRSCGVDRGKGVGYCGMGENLTVARAALHMWEEPCISGENGSGAVFFSGCVLRCVFCQNRDIAAGSWGREITQGRLADIFLELQEQHANNINLVTPTHFVPWIARALEDAKNRGLGIPVVYNTGSFETPETIGMMDGLVDIYLPDIKYYDDKLAADLSNAPHYHRIAMDALEAMYSQVGNPQFLRGASALRVGVEDGMMAKGVIVRHLLLPGHLEDSKAVVRSVYEEYGDAVYISLMNQYTPMAGVGELHPELGRCVTSGEYGELVDYAVSLGVVNGFVQEEGTVGESFIPAFDYTGV